MLVAGGQEESEWASLLAAAVSFEQSLDRLVSSLETAGRELQRARHEYACLLAESRRAEARHLASSPLQVLSAQERKVALVAALGRSDAEVAAAMHLSVHTVKSHMKSVLRKLGLHSRWQLAHLVASGYRARLLA